MATRKAVRKTTSSWIVRVERTVLTDVVVNGCTEDEARSDPFKFAVEETDVDLIDYTVRRVEQNT